MAAGKLPVIIGVVMVLIRMRRAVRGMVVPVMSVMIVMMMIVIFIQSGRIVFVQSRFFFGHFDPERRQSAAGDPFRIQPQAVNTEAVKQARNGVGVCARVDQRGQQHVPGRAGESIEMKMRHRNPSCPL